MRTPARTTTSPARRPRRVRAGAVAAAVAAAVLVAVSPGSAHADVPYAAGCPSTEQNPTANPAYGIPIRNQISNGTLTQGTSTITNIDASVCGILQFPSLSATIPASDIHYSTATATFGGVIPVGTVDITANGPSTAVTSATPAPNGGLIFTLTAHTFNKINVSLSLTSLLTPSTTLPIVGSLPTLPIIGSLPTLPGGGSLPTLPGTTLTAVSCDATLDATLNTAPSANSSPLTGSLSTGAQGVAYAGKGSVSISGLTPDPSDTAVGSILCPIVQSVLGVPSTDVATFKAPISFFSTLTSF